MLYGQQYIRKSTALYLLQENISLSNDRLLRVRRKQLTHIHNFSYENIYPGKHIKTCDLCIFHEVDNPQKCVLGRILQFSYMEGGKKAREFSGDYVDLDTTKAELSNIGAFCNWYIGTDKDGPTIGFFLTNDYTQGYLSLDNYMMTIPDDRIISSEDFAFEINEDYLENCLGNDKL